MEWIESIRFLGIRVINISDFSELLIRFALNTVMLFIIVRQIYMKHSTRHDYTFSYIAVGETVFLLCFLLGNVKLELGFALGLFAIFGIIRYRTDAIPFKQMTYLFVVIGVSVINALTTKKVSHAELLTANAVILGGLWLLERNLSRNHERMIVITYDNITNIHIERYDLLVADLKERTGFNVTHFEIIEIDYLKDAATMKIYFDHEYNCFINKEEQI